MVEMPNQRIAKILLALYFLIPFLILPIGRDTYTEWIFPRVVFVLMLGLMSLLLFRKEILSINPVVLFASAAYLFLTLLSDFLSPDELVFKVVGHEERYDGLLYQAGKILAFLSALILLKKQKPSQAYSFVGSGFLIIAILQAVLLASHLFLNLDIVGKLLYEGQNNKIPIGTVGFKVLLILSIGTGLLYILIQETKVWKFTSIPLAFVAGLAAGRASAIGLIASLFTGSWLHYRSRFFLKAIFFLIVVLVFSTAFVFRNQILAPFGARPITTLSAYTLQTRIVIWKISIRLLETHNWLLIRGLGSDAMRYLLIKELPKDPVLRSLYIQSMIMENRLPADTVENLEIVTRKEFGLRATALHLVYRTREEPDRTKHFLAAVNLDKAHNLWLDLWIRYGLLATLLYTFITFGPLFFLIGPLFKSTLDQWKPKAFAWVGLALFAHGIHYLAWFPMPLWEPLFLLIAALGWNLVGNRVA